MKGRPALSQRDIEHHHEDEAKREGDGAPVGVPPLGHLRDQFLDHHIHHGACRKGEKVGHDGDDGAGCHDGDKGGNGFHDTGEHAVEEGHPLVHPFSAKRHRYDGALREVLDGDAQRQGQCACGRDARVAAAEARIDHADSHAFRDIVKRNGEDQLRRALQPCFGAFVLVVHVHVRRDFIQEEQKTDADEEAYGSRNKGQLPQMRAALQRRLQEAPEGSGDHDAGGKPGQDLLQVFGDAFFQHENHGSAEAGADKRDQDTG